MRSSFHQGFDLGLALRSGMLSATAWRRMSRRIFAACSRPVSVDRCKCCCIWSRAQGDRFLRKELKCIQSAFLKLNCWQMGWITVCSRRVVVRSKRITSWSDPGVCLIINCPAGNGLCRCRGCKGEVKDGGAYSISVVVGRSDFFVKELEVVGVCPMDDCLWSFWFFD